MRTFTSISISLFALAILCFFLPFADISCSGHKIGTVTGFQMATGTDMEGRHMNPEPLAGLALGATVLGLLLSFATAKPSKILPMLAGLAGGAFLLMLKTQLDKDALKEGMGMLQADYQAGFWGSVVLMFIAAVLNLTALIQPEPTNPHPLGMP